MPALKPPEVTIDPSMAGKYEQDLKDTNATQLQDAENDDLWTTNW